MTTSLVLTTSLAAELETAAANELETAGVLLVSVVESASGLRLLARGVRWVQRSGYIDRQSNSLVIASDGYVHALAEAEHMGATALWLHTHPRTVAGPLPSPADAIVDSELASVFRVRTGSRYYGSLIVSPEPQGFTFWGQIEPEGAETQAIERAWVVGDRFREIWRVGRNGTGLSQEFDRNVRAFGAPIQATLSGLRVGVVGCGGTGSAVAEQLVRLGVKSMTLIDPDQLTLSNVTRVYGSRLANVGQSKVDVLKEHLKQIRPELEVRAIRSSIVEQTAAKCLIDCDIVFGCTDDNAGRLILSRFASYLMTPVIDCGVLLSSNASGLTGIDGRVTTLVPGQACLVCRGRIDLARAAAESMSADEHQRRAREGYAPELDGVEPAVIAFTTAVASSAVIELLERLVGYGPDVRPSEVLLRIHEREVSTNRAEPRGGHYCDPRAGRLGYGVSAPFLDLTWSQ